MTTLDTEMAAAALELLTNYGVDAAITVPNDAYDTDTGVCTRSGSPVTVKISPPKIEDVLSQAGVSISLTCYTTLNGQQVADLASATLTYESVTYHVTQVYTFYSGSLIAIYKLWLQQ